MKNKDFDEPKHLEETECNNYIHKEWFWHGLLYGMIIVIIIAAIYGVCILY